MAEMRSSSKFTKLKWFGQLFCWRFPMHSHTEHAGV